MRKSVLLVLALLLSYSAFAQSKVAFLQQHFDSEDFPSDWSVAGEGTANWSIWQTHQAGGDPGEVKLYWRPAFNGTARLVSPTLNLTGFNEIIFSFKGFLDNYMDVPHQIGVATSSDDGTTWNIAWEESFSTHNQGQHSFINTITTPDIGKDNVKFCIFYTGDSNNMNGWYFDDIEIYTLDQFNLSMLEINFPEIVGTESNTIGFKVQNTGIDTIESFEAQYQVEGRSPVIETFNTNMESTSKADFTFEQKLTLAPGTYSLTIKILNVNGSDDVATDNEVTAQVDAAIGTAQRFPMIEHFSSSTCAPCVVVNEQMALLTDNNPGKYTYTKYAMNWPLEGDAYCTEEALTRKSYYYVSGAPQLFLDGKDNGGASISEQDFNNEYNKPSYIDIKGAFQLEGSVINITADVMSLVNIPEARVFVSVNEKTTTENASYNGETEFHHIMMKMLENANGTPTSFNVGEYQRFEFSYDMDTTFVEELDDLEVAVWAQNYDTYEIYNSHFLYEYTEHPYPAQNLQLNSTENELTINWEAPATGEPTGYNLYINNELTLENTAEMSHIINDVSGLYTIKVVAVYENNMTSVGIADYAIIGDEAFPCLPPTNLNATVEQDAEDYEYNFKVNMTWDAADYANQYMVYLDGELLETTSETSLTKGFDEEGEHYFTVTAICENGESEQSEAFNFELIGISVEESSIENFVTYPNPASDFVKLSAVSCQPSIVRIYNTLGMLIDEIEMKSNEVEINVSDYKPGIYFIKVQTENGNVIKKIIVE